MRSEVSEKHYDQYLVPVEKIPAPGTGTPVKRLMLTKKAAIMKIVFYASF